jgi:S-formylglutathione hydrolase
MAIRFLFIALTTAISAVAQSSIIDATVHSPGLEHNLLGDPADQGVSIYVPDAYQNEPERHFPVLIFLHGYSDPTSRHSAAVLFQGMMDRLIASGTAKPMIIVLPNGINKYKGAFYTNSSVTGDWEGYIVRDVIAYVDTHYRTVPEQRGITGHSMGGYGALTLAFRHPEVFRAVYAMSPCCTDLIEDLGPSNPAWGRVNELTSPDQVPQALSNGQFFVAAMSALDAALAPDAKAQTFGDAPFYRDGRQVRTNADAMSASQRRCPYIWSVRC